MYLIWQSTWKLPMNGKALLKHVLHHRRIHFFCHQTGLQTLDCCIFPKALSPQHKCSYYLWLNVVRVIDFTSIDVSMGQTQAQNNMLPFGSQSLRKLVHLSICWWTLQNTWGNFDCICKKKERKCKHTSLGNAANINAEPWQGENKQSWGEIIY